MNVQGMTFTKMHGIGNDFAVVAGFAFVPEGISDLARAVCDRHFGVGADGLVLILPHDGADFSMRIFNADGSESEQCGNAVRCVAKYVYDKGMTDQTEVVLETRVGLQRLQLIVEDGRVARATVDMGQPILAGAQVPTTIAGDQVVAHPIKVAGHGEHRFTAVSMGNPHAVIFVDSLEEIDLHGIGPQIETHEFFPRKTNVEFVQVHGPAEVTMHVWERGVGETLACGSGACSVVVAAALENRTGRDVVVHLKGGDLRIEWREDGHVYMTGPSAIIYDGIWMP